MNKRLKALKTYTFLWAMKLLLPVIADCLSPCVTGKAQSPAPCQTYNGLQPDMTVTRQEEREAIEAKPEKQRVYHYMVEVSTHQMLYQTVEIVSDHPLTDEQIAERTVEEAQKGSWEEHVATPGQRNCSRDPPEISRWPTQ